MTDAASQRVHAFDAEGRVLLAFGEPSDGPGALSVPGGICISAHCPVEDPALPDGFAADYFVLVAEQLLRPGIRVYAWGRNAGATSNIQMNEAMSELAMSSGTINPHWSAERCSSCHNIEVGIVKSLRDRTDHLCVSCHDGKKARAEAHPIARLASTAQTSVPKGWPLVEGRLGCLTCHDIRRHCDPNKQRPAVNPSMLRAFDPVEPMRICVQCHQAGESWRISPHKNLDAAGQVIASSCTFCHIRTPPMPPDGKRTGQTLLHADGSRLCLTCHARHWDVSALGHVDREATERTRKIMSVRLVSTQELRHDGIGAAGSRNVSTLLPLFDRHVRCYSCHNPHQAGLFPPDSPLGAFSTAAADAHAALRVASAHLCLQCHSK